MPSIALTLPSLRAAYNAGTSPQDIVEQVFDRIKNVDDPGIFIHLLDKSEVLNAAKALGAYDASKPLWGVPFAIKDNIDAAGKPIVDDDSIMTTVTGVGCGNAERDDIGSVLGGHTPCSSTKRATVASSSSPDSGR